MAPKRTRKEKGSGKLPGSSSKMPGKRSPSMADEPVNPLPPYSGEEIEEAVGAGLIHRSPRSQRGSPELSGGDVDASSDREDEGEEMVGGSHATPAQDVIEELGKAVGVTYSENEPLRLGEKEEQRDSQRWELDPASSEDYQEHVARGRKREHTEQD